MRPTIEPVLVNDLVDFLRKLQGRAALRAKDTIAVPLPDGAEDDTAYQELRALLHRWESMHPGIRLEIVPETQPDARALGSVVPRRARRTAKVH